MEGRTRTRDGRGRVSGPALIRGAIALLGLAGIAVGGSALSKVADANLDSPRWMFVAAAALSIGAGLGLVAYAVRGLSLKRRSRSTRR